MIVLLITLIGTLLFNFTFLAYFSALYIKFHARYLHNDIFRHVTVK